MLSLLLAATQQRADRKLLRSLTRLLNMMLTT